MFERLSDLYEEHKGKLWEFLSVVQRSDRNDKFRPKDLPKTCLTIGKPKERGAKPRAANPFKRKRVLQKVCFKEICSIQFNSAQNY